MDLIRDLRQRLYDQYFQDWSGALVVSRKLRMYRRFKNTLNYEPYLNLPPYLRVPLTRLRTSAHGLKIETGRYTVPIPTPIEERLCDVCEVIEDEIHFLVDCVMLGDIRKELFSYCNTLLPSFRHKSSEDKFIYIMSSSDSHLLSLLANAVSQGLFSRTAYLVL